MSNVKDEIADGPNATRQFRGMAKLQWLSGGAMLAREICFDLRERAINRMKWQRWVERNLDLARRIIAEVSR